MRRKLITKTWTFWGHLYVFLALGSILYMLALSKVLTVWEAIAIAASAVGYVAATIIVVNRQLNTRSKALESYAEAHTYGFNSINTLQYLAELGAVDDLNGARNCTVKNMIAAPGWTYADFSYEIYHRTKHGEYKAATVYYGVMSVKLSRHLPNVFFDSIKARHRQFRFHFARHQRHSLEGDFDKYFVTYFPDDYTIDSMSFIAPDVMVALEAAADYDIEIFGDTLFLYGPLFDPETQIADMQAKIMAIQQKLADNITSYRDERIPFAEGRKRVAERALVLKGSSFWRIVGIVGTIAWIALYIASQIWDTN